MLQAKRPNGEGRGGDTRVNECIHPTGSPYFWHVILTAVWSSTVYPSMQDPSAAPDPIEVKADWSGSLRAAFSGMRKVSAGFCATLLRRLWPGAPRRLKNIQLASRCSIVASRSILRPTPSFVCRPGASAPSLPSTTKSAAILAWSSSNCPRGPTFPFLHPNPSVTINSRNYARTRHNHQVFMPGVGMPADARSPWGHRVFVLVAGLVSLQWRGHLLAAGRRLKRLPSCRLQAFRTARTSNTWPMG